MVNLFRRSKKEDTLETTMHNKEESSSGDATLKDETVNGVRRTEYGDKMFVTGVSIDDCVRVIGEVQHYPEFLTVYKSVDIMWTQMDPVTGEKVERATYNIHMFFLDVNYVLETRIDQRDDYAKKIWNQVSGPSWLLVNSGAWTLYKSGDTIEIQYDFDLSFTMWIPDFFKKWVINHAMKNSMEAVKKRILFVHQQRMNQSHA